MRRNDRTDFDVIVLGAGIAGTMLATILARRGFSVLMLDGGVHPRFVVGESTIPHTSLLLTLLSREHDVPELDYLGLGSPKLLREHVTRKCGIKRIFGFAYHRPGEEHDPREAHQTGHIWRDENHFFRQDIDSYFFTTAIKYGAYGVEGVKIESVETNDDGVAVVAGGKRYTGKFVADGTGFRSVLANTFDVRERPCSLFTNTRSIFSHMIDVAPFEEVAPTIMRHKWSQATLHHCFKRGWIWVIPFNNWEGAPNRLVSVGATVDTDLYPEDSSLSPEEEFARFVEMFPSVARQFENAKQARPWVRTRRLQYSSTATVGKRWALLSHAGGFIDPLFSRGLISTVDNLRSLSRVLVEALTDGDFSEERFVVVDAEQKRNITYADKLVAGSYIAWDDFSLWDAWVRVWAVGTLDTESRLFNVLNGNFTTVKPTTNPVHSEYEGPNYRTFFEQMWDAIQAYEKKELSLEQARAKLWSILTPYDFTVPLPAGFRHQEWALTNSRCRDLFLGHRDRHARWAARLGDPELIEGADAGV